MSGSVPRPKRKSTNPKPEVAPEEVLYTDKDYSGDTLDLELDSLCPNPFNKREMKGIPELAATIEEVGLLQNIAHIRADIWLKTYPETAEKITAPNVILFGEHRWRAVRTLGWRTISSVLRDDKVGDARLITLIENLRRAQLSPLEEAEHYQALREDGLSYEQIAEKVGETANGAISKGTVWKRVQLLDLDPEIQEALRVGTLKVSAAEKLQKLDGHDQREALELVRGGMHPVEAQAQILARQRQVEDAPDSEIAPNAHEAETVSTGNGVRPAVSTGNGSPPAPRTRQKEKAKPVGDDYEQDRRAAAAARDAACQRLLQSIDPKDPATSELLLQVLTAALLAPPQQSAAQQRALAWLRKVDRHGLDEPNAGAYFNAVQESGDTGLQRLAAFASSLAAGELRTSARRQAWGSREIGYVRVLQEHAQYVPETEWEKKELGLATAGDNR